ncbi:MAG: 2-oxoglutarate dehydrogenase complex dihydrolipoyllysine-residue succinyltransferase [Rickettsiaceae bacterium]
MASNKIIDIKVPALGESVSEATIAKWYKLQGEQVEADELLLELETEKVTLEVNATSSGVLAKLFKQEGDNVEVDEVIGHIDSSVSSSQVVSKPELDVKNTDKKPIESKLSPSVSKLVSENNLNPADIPGSGKGGRITKGDVLDSLTTAPISSKGSDDQVDDGRFIEKVKMSRLRKTIATRLKESQNTAAILSTFNEIDMSNVMSMRKKYREAFEKKHNAKLGFMSFFVKASIHALRSVPSVNAEIDGDYIIYKNYYDIGVAVGTEQGLVVPVIRNSDNRSFASIESTLLDLGKKARDGKLSMKDLSGATFTISNGGVYGSLLSTPIINPPQSGILGLHKIQQRPVAIDGNVEIRPMMYIALSYDHRIIDGKDAVTFLVKVKEAIENPESLLLDM